MKAFFLTVFALVVCSRLAASNLRISESPTELFGDRAPLSQDQIWPTEGNIVSCYKDGWRPDHDGVDIAADVGTPIIASSDGKVMEIDPAIGKVVVRVNGGYVHTYLHNEEIYVLPGQLVSQGELIAAMGSRGFSTGPHLHFSIYKNGASVNPFPLLPTGGPSLTAKQQEIADQIPSFVPHQRCLHQMFP
ncbi:MAG: M23 family metallopeptidase [Pseudobacteriovorax sp.]|nr:M23 family metallopeptidase [Pseudobacteriovorax sp.]